MPDQKVAVVTGTSSGIGLHTAVGLAARGIRVVATMRDTAKAERLRAEAADQGVELTVRRLDVTDHEGAHRCLDEVAADFGPIDILVNNAGQSTAGTLEQLDAAALQQQLDVNVLGPAALTRHVLPSMRSAGAGRIVSVSSNGGVHGEPFLDAYCASKFALEGLMQSLAPVAARFGVTVSVVEPAAVATHMADNLDTRALFSPDDPYRELAEKFLQTAQSEMANAQSAQAAAAVVVEAATTDSPRFRWQTSQAAVSLAGLSLADMDGSNVLTATSQWI
ncbi:SDR family oxidoreductase [Streptomyces iconiensis]|uniref:SDR family oxidoreductase n=1 Tax=Streptomyces iconiensis TaxID=1384038 RepID=A0ABT7A090_9ACTN|nr:SDR family oxidoreductase [Streptomyces iconiensis]MDJ1134750.1 SDR family oxidoreductase [Streptomyces iconiensis]